MRMCYDMDGVIHDLCEVTVLEFSMNGQECRHRIPSIRRADGPIESLNRCF
jgi:hypothetical protein